jgi:putative CocE/NonD family hydrolase
MRRLFPLISMIVAVAGFYSTDSAAQASTDKPTTQASPSAVIYHNVMIPMRDGIRLATDIYIPSNDGGVTPAPGRFPALLMRTPYGKKGRADAPPPAAVSHGYVVVRQDVRGTFSSEGVFEPMLNEGTDGFDTMAWLRKQPWADGRVGTFGGSYLGGDQMLLAAEQPQGLVAAFASVAATDLFNNEWVYMYGVFALDTATKWTSGRVRGFNSRLPKFEQKPLEDDYASLGIATAQSMTPEIVIKLMKSLPLRDAPIVRRAPWWSRWLDNASNPRYFKSTEMVNRFQYINIPILHLGGWYDQFLRNTYEHFKGVSTQAKSSSVRANQRLVIGPWTHGPCDGFSFPNSTVDQDMMQSAWMDSWFKGKKHPFFDYPVVLYVMGENRWRAEESWPLAGIQRTRYYLRGQGSANTANGNGMLSTIAPSSEPSDRFAYDPHNPAPTLGGIGSNIGCRAEQNDAERRPDILVFTSPEYRSHW